MKGPGSTDVLSARAIDGSSDVNGCDVRIDSLSVTGVDSGLVCLALPTRNETTVNTF
jgi:hypothetical protein